MNRFPISLPLECASSFAGAFGFADYACPAGAYSGGWLRLPSFLFPYIRAKVSWISPMTSSSIRSMLPLDTYFSRSALSVLQVVSPGFLRRPLPPCSSGPFYSMEGCNLQTPLTPAESASSFGNQSGRPSRNGRPHRALLDNPKPLAVHSRARPPTPRGPVRRGPFFAAAPPARS